MLYRFTIVTDEVEDFFREIVIGADATFLDLNKAILNSCGYPDDQMTSFFICDDEWEKEIEVTREDMGADLSDEDIYVMADTQLNELIEDEQQRLLFVFDPFNERALYLQLKEIVLKRNYDEAVCTRSRGKAPRQLLQSEKEILKPGKNNITLGLDDDADFLSGDNDFDTEELDPEGFEFSEGNPYE